jgi:hypothetical protein
LGCGRPLSSIVDVALDWLAGQATREVMAVGGKQPVRNGREWAKTLSLLFALPALFLLMGLMIRSCDTPVGYEQGIVSVVRP